MRRDLGDFQTPPELVAEVLEAVGPIGGRWPRVLEPTCGRGHFIAGLLARSNPPREIQAIEIQESHHQAACAVVAAGGKTGVHVQITRGDMFGIDVGRDLRWRERGPLLVIGNPPWVTNSELGSLASTHRPPRHNLKGLRGLEARTGSSNFDVTEAIWIKLALELVDQQPTIAFLCKTSVARSILQYAHCSGLPVSSASIRRIDAARWFRAAVDACLFCVTLDCAYGRCPPCEGTVGEGCPEGTMCRPSKRRDCPAATHVVDTGLLEPECATAQHGHGLCARLPGRGPCLSCALGRLPTAFVRYNGGKGSSMMRPR